MPKELALTISDAVWESLQARSKSSGHTIESLVHQMLAEALDVAHHSVFQVSTSGAIVQGLYQGSVTLGDLRNHGDLGLGTFVDLDGEMIVIDGCCYQARSDGSVRVASDDELTPFATVVSFAPALFMHTPPIDTFADLTGALDTVRTSANYITAIRIDGTFDHVRVRTACKHASGTHLVAATQDQQEFDFTDIAGSMVGFWSPPFTAAIGIEGYHLHFISDDRAHGGHVLDIRSGALKVNAQEVTDVHLSMPETADFAAADLTGDTAAAISIAEH